MADITAAQINDSLGLAVFVDSGGAGPLVLDMSALTGKPLTLESGVAHPLFLLMKSASEAASAGAVSSYRPIVRSTLPDGRVKHSAFLVVMADLVEKVTALGVSPIMFNNEPMTFANGQTLDF
ncbi:MAG: hypothetical protein AAGB19_09470 [Cyanobacteria bacterium P01_F01_bin.3]